MWSMRCRERIGPGIGDCDETIVDEVTGAVVHERDERLSEYVGHGNAANSPPWRITEPADLIPRSGDAREPVGHQWTSTINLRHLRVFNGDAGSSCDAQASMVMT